MNTLFFKYALEVERTRSITQAAENMFMAQPNLSRAIKEMEDTLGFVIFERTSKGVVPTKKGTAFLTYARNIVGELENMERIKESDSTDIQRFSISIPRGSYIADSITNFIEGLDQDRDMELNIQETNSVQTINNIENGKFKLGIIRYQTENEPYFKNFLKEKHLKHDLVWEFECVLAMSKKHELASLPVITQQDLKQYVEISHGDISVPYVDTVRHREWLESETKKKIYLYERSNQFEILSRVPTTFMWVSPIPEHIINKYGLIQRRCIFEGNHFKDMLVYSEDYRMTPLDKNFIEHLYQSKTEVCFKDYR